MSNYPNFKLTLFFKLLLAAPFGRFFSIHCEKPLSAPLDKPCLLLFNHATYLDPLFLHIFSRLPVAFLTNREYFRYSWLAFLLKRVGCIPKTKGKADPYSIRTALRIRKTNRAHIGVAVTEGRNWDGITNDLMEGTEKLVKKMRLPVVAVVLRGAYLSMPRWCLKRHRGPIWIGYYPIISPQECADLSLAEIRSRILTSFAIDDYQWQQKMHFRYRGVRRAERIERLLFLCPSCHAVESIHSEGNAFFCKSCHKRSVLNEEGFFKAAGDSQTFALTTPPDWNSWQQAHLLEMVKANTFTHCDEDATLFIFTSSSNASKAPQPIYGTVSFSQNQLGFFSGDRQLFSLSPNDISGITNQYHDCVEFYEGERLYRIKLGNPHASPYLWYSLLKLSRSCLQDACHPFNPDT